VTSGLIDLYQAAVATLTAGEPPTAGRETPAR